jgi:hypothetical protein
VAHDDDAEIPEVIGRQTWKYERVNLVLAKRRFVSLKPEVS